MITSSPQETQRLYHELHAAGVLVDSVNSDGLVKPDAMQAAAQPIIDAFVPDTSLLARQRMYDAAAASLGADTDAASILLMGFLVVLATDTHGSLDELVTKVKAAILARRPT